jgi:Arc/MetJ family transcription regulator
MSRTNIDIDDRLLELAMRQHGFKTKKDAVNHALRRIVVEPMTTEEILAMEGTGWEGDLDEMRRMDTSLEAWIREQDAERERGGGDE